MALQPAPWPLNSAADVATAWALEEIDLDTALALLAPLREWFSSSDPNALGAADVQWLGTVMGQDDDPGPTGDLTPEQRYQFVSALNLGLTQSND